MRQISLFMTIQDDGDDDDLPLPELIARGGKDWGAFPLQSQDVDGKRFYAVQDWIAGVSLTDQPRVVLALMKRRLTKDKIQLFSSCEQLKYRASNGKNYKMDFADAETLYKITQRMDANTGIRNRVLDYLAKAGVIVDEQRRDPGKAIDSGIAGYKRKGKDDSWIKTRIDGKVDRKAFVAALTAAITGFDGNQFSRATNVGYKSVFGLDAPGIRQLLGLSENANVREHMSRTGLAYVSLMESIVADHLGQQHDLTLAQGFAIIKAVGASIKPAVDAYRNQLGVDPISGRPLLPSVKGRRN